MTIELTQIDFTYSGDGQQIQFPTPFFQFPEDIAASLRPAVGAAQPLQYGTDYSLSGALAPNGGTLTIIDPSKVPGPSIGTLIIRTDTQPTQERAFPRGGAISNLNYERSLDKLTMLIIRLFDDLSRSVHAPVEDLAGPMFLPLEYLRAGGFLGFDGTGLPLVYSLAELVALLTPLIIGTVSIKTLPKSREELGLKGDGGTDDSVQLVKMMRADSLKGGATYFLQPQDNQTFYLQHGISIPSNINLIFSGLGVTLGDGAFVRIEGSLAVDEGHLFTLSSDIAVGDTRFFFNTGAAGGGAVSDYFAAGDAIALNGFRDAADNIQRAEHTVLSVDTVSVTVAAPGVAAAFSVAYAAGDYTANWGLSNVTQVYKITSTLLTVDGAKGADSISASPANLASFQIGDFVLLQDDATCATAAPGGSSSKWTSREIFQITGISGTTVTFSRKLEHDFRVDYHARMIMLNPATGASVSGCSAAFTTPPTVDAATFEISRAVSCIIANCLVPNEDSFGAFGPMFAIYQSLNSAFVGPSGRNHKSLGAGQGRGLVIRESTACSAIEPDISGCRINVEFACATQCHVAELLAGDERYLGIAFAGQGEVGCTVTLRSIIGSNAFAPGVSVKRAIRFGAADGMVGPSRCVVEDGRVAQYKGANTAVVDFMAGSEECRVTSAMDDITTAVWSEDSPNNGSIISRKNKVQAVVNGYDGRLADIDGNRNGALLKTVQDLTLDLQAYDGSKQVRLRHADGVLLNLKIDKVSPDVSEPFGVDAFDVARLKLWRSDMIGVTGGVALQSCPSAYIIKCIFADFVGGTTVLKDNGGNNNYQWLSNDVVGFTGTVDTSGGGPSPGGVTTYPVLIT